MFRVLIAVAVLTLPCLAGADEVWRWRDPAGHLHYSNVKANVPADAEPVRKRIEIVHRTAVEPGVERAERVPAGTPRRQVERPAYRYEGSGCGGGYPYLCSGFAIPYILTLQGNDLADQVKEAALLDALHVRWRNGCP